MATEVLRELTDEHIKLGIRDFDKGVHHEFGPSTAYDLLYEGRRYPPKAIVGLAARHAVGRTLTPDEFSGGVASTASRVLENLGFEIVRKSGSSGTEAGTDPSPLSPHLEAILAEYRTAREGAPFGKEHPLWNRFESLAAALKEHPAVRSRPTLRVAWSAGQGNWAKVPWISFLDERETTTTQDGVYVVYLFREDMSGVYLTFNQGVTRLKKRHGTKEARQILRERAEKLQRFLPRAAEFGFALEADDGEGIDLRTGPGIGRDYEHSTIASKLYRQGEVPSDDKLFQDLEQVLEAYDQYLESDERARPDPPEAPEGSLEAATTGPPTGPFDPAAAIEDLIGGIEAEGFLFEPWQVAQYVTAVRTKPFVILAGITGTGKSRLPRLVAEFTGGASELVPVRPDWTDSADVLGYTDLQGTFRPGAILEAAHRAMEEDDVHWTVVVDEMNLARVEQYFAEVLSRIEERLPDGHGGFRSRPLLAQALPEGDAEWGDVPLPPNLALVGTVNMDESAHGFSRKVLDRAFTIELSEVDLGRLPWSDSEGSEYQRNGAAWPVQAWSPRATRLAELTQVTEEERQEVERATNALTELNQILSPAQLQVGYRTRDEIALFLLHAREVRNAFVDRGGEAVDPMDLALQMKLLPRIVGGSSAIQQVLLGLLGWAWTGTPLKQDTDATDRLEDWEDAGRPTALPGARYPRFASRLCLMWERLRAEGFTSYWL